MPPAEPPNSPTPAEEKRIFRLPVFTASFCQALLDELENFECSDLPKGRPNTMNNYGVGEASERTLGHCHLAGVSQCLHPGETNKSPCNVLNILLRNNPRPH